MLFLLFIYLILLLLIGWTAGLQARQPKNFYIAGQSAGILDVTLSLCATILGSSAILGTLSLTQTIGWAASWLMLCAGGGLLCLLPLAKYVRRYGKFTFPDLLESFYGKELRLLACALIPVTWTGVIAAQIIGGGKIISFVTPLNYSQGAVVSGICFTLYTFWGGQISVIKTDLWQSLFIIAALTAALSAGMQTWGAPSWEQLHASFPFNAHFSAFDLFILLLTYGSLFLVGPDIYSRLFCARDERTATLSVLLTSLIIAPIGFILAFIGTVGNAHGFNFLTRGILPAVLAIGLLSAMLSSADTTLLTAAAIFTQLFRNLNDAPTVKITRAMILVFGGLSTLIALSLTSIIQSLLLAYSFFAGAFIIPIIAGLLGYRTSKNRAVMACVLGGSLALAGKLCEFSNTDLGNQLIIAAFIINAGILFSSNKTKDKRPKTNDQELKTNEY